MSMGFKRATENLMTSESVTKWSKWSDWSECVAKRVAKWTGSTTGSESEVTPTMASKISKRNVCEVATIT